MLSTANAFKVTAADNFNVINSDVKAEVAATSISGITNKYPYVRMAPYWTAEVVDTMASGVNITIIERDYEYLYVQYYNGITKRGYIPRADTSNTGYSWCNHTIFESGKYNGSGSRIVYYYPGGAQSGSIDADEGISANKPLLILRAEGDYYYIQYLTNPTNTGIDNVRWKRGWILKSSLYIANSSYPAGLPTSDMIYLRNKQTGKYLDLQGYSGGNYDGGNTHLWDFHGGYNQEWIINKVYTPYSTYVKLATNQGTEQRVLRVSEKTAVTGNNIDICAQTSPAKDQEFILKSAGDGSYYIVSRCGGNFLVVGVDPSDSGTGGEIYLRFPDGSDYNKWYIERGFEQIDDYVYSDLGNIPSGISNGIAAKYDTRDVCRVKTEGSYTYNFTEYTQQVFNSCNAYPNSNISLAADSSSYNKIIWEEDVNKRVDENGNIYYVLGSTAALNNSTQSRTITMYYGSFIQYFQQTSVSYTYNDIPQLWKSTLAHELGHTLGLDHPVNEYSVMSYNRDKFNIISPGKMDIAGVKKLYSQR